MIKSTSTFLFVLAAVLLESKCARRNDTIMLPANERYRRLIPYMTFYLHQDGANNNFKQNENNLDLPRYQGYNQGFNHGFIHNNHNQQNNYVPYQLPRPNGYYLQGPQQSLVKSIAQNYLSVKNRPSVPVASQYVTSQLPKQHHPQQIPQQQQPRLPHPPQFLTGFKPMDPAAISITQSQEIPIQHNTQRPSFEANNSPRPFLLGAEHNSLRPYIDQESRRPYPEEEPHRQYIEQESPRPYIQVKPQRPYSKPVSDSPRPFVVTVEPNSHPHPHPPPAEQTSQKPFIQYVTTLKPQYYTPVSNHIYQSPSADYHEDNTEGYDISQILPTRITSDNLESSIKTLSRLLQILQKANPIPQGVKKVAKVKVIHPTVIKYPIKSKPHKQHLENNDFDDEGSTPGKPGVDYPTYTKIPETRFSCKEQRYKGFFADPETNCQVWHYCDLNGGQASFLCPNGTIFSQVALTCDWWFNVKCASTPQLYVLNERLYKYIIPQKPSFPEDFAGPLVDRYLEQKYRELEEKRLNETKTDSEEEHNEQPAHETNQARAINY